MIMKTSKLLTLSCLIALVFFAGCRREDVRELTILLPGLAEANTNTIVKALSAYAGVKPDSIRWDIPGGKLTLRYDSMMIARINILDAIDAVRSDTFTVVYPEKTDDHAGY